MTRPRKAKTTAANERRRNRLAPMKTNDIEGNGDICPSTDGDVTVRENAVQNTLSASWIASPDAPAHRLDATLSCSSLLTPMTLPEARFCKHCFETDGLKRFCHKTRANLKCPHNNRYAEVRECSHGLAPLDTKRARVEVDEWKQSLTRESNSASHREKRVALDDDTSNNIKARDAAAHKEAYHRSQLSREQYMAEFDARKNGELKDQQWALQEMDKLHTKLGPSVLNLGHCSNCRNLWPTEAKNWAEPDYVCLTCKPDLTKFSSANDMVPDSSWLPSAIQQLIVQLTDIEKLLCALYLPFMSIIRMKGSGKTKLAGHIATFRQDSLNICLNLPRLSSTLPTQYFSRSNGTESKLVHVNRDRVGAFVAFLVSHCPVYIAAKAVLDKENLARLPLDGIPTDIVLNEETNDIPGPLRSGPDVSAEDSGPDIYHSFCELPGGAILESDKVKEALGISTSTAETTPILDWPSVDPAPLNEFEVVGLMSGAFPHLHPLGIADPFNKSRLKAVPLNQHGTHLLRFAEIHHIRKTLWYPFMEDPRYAFMLNDICRRFQELGQANVFLKKNPSDTNLDVDELVQMACGDGTEARDLLGRMSTFSANLAGSPAYWQQRSKELDAIMQQKQPATVWFTHSAAANHWYDLSRLMPDGLQRPANRTAQAGRNPHLVDWFFSHKFDAFLKHFYTNVLDMEWTWHRYEYQHDTTLIHAHGFGACKNDPGLFKLVALMYKAEQLGKPGGNMDETDLPVEEMERIQKQADWAKDLLCRYADTMINEWNPRSSAERAAKAGVYPDPHPCAVSLLAILKDEESMENHVEEWLNYCERHVCHLDSYCQKKDGKRGCKFGFEKELRDETTVIFTELKNGKVRAEIHHRRNDGFLNSCNSMQGQHWQANCDMKLLIDFQRAKAYAVKYVTKSEPMSRDSVQIFKTIMQSATDASRTTSLLRKAFLQMSQVNHLGKGQVSRMLSGGHLYSSTYQFVTINCDLNTVKLVKDSAGNLVFGPDIKTFFAKRDLGLRIGSLFEFGRQYEVKGGKLKKLSNPEKIVVKLVPKFSSAVLGKQYPKYCMFTLIAFSNWNAGDEKELMNESTAVTRFLAFMRTAPTSTKKLIVTTTELDEIDEEFTEQTTRSSVKNKDAEGVEGEDGDGERSVDDSDDWRDLSKMMPALHEGGESVSLLTETVNVDWVGHRTLDYTQEQLTTGKLWMANLKINQGGAGSRSVPLADPSSMNDKQRLAYDIFCTGVESGNQVLMIMTGRAGSGKSFVINAITSQLSAAKCLRAAPSGTAAFLIGGLTLHSLLHLPVTKKPKTLPDLKGESLKNLQNTFKGVTALIIDEYSMVSAAMLSMIDLRLRQATCRLDLPFGGISILLVGDNAQLQPVGGMEVFRLSESPKAHEAEGQAVFFLFTLVLKLSTIMRQKDDANDADQAQFKSLLLTAPFGIYSIKDWKFLVKDHPVTPLFRDAVHLFALNAKKIERNESRLLELGQSVKWFKAVNSNATARKLPSEDFNGLENNLFLARGARVMVISNLWTDEGVTNGACGTVVDMIFLEAPTLPSFAEFLVIEMDIYAGPSFFPEDPVRTRYVAIPPYTVVSKDNGSLSRTQFPLVLAYGISIHKSQGASLDRCVVDLGENEFAAGLAYVGFSRVKHHSGLAVVPFSYDRLEKIRHMFAVLHRNRENIRLEELELETIRKWNGGDYQADIFDVSFEVSGVALKQQALDTMALNASVNAEQKDLEKKRKLESKMLPKTPAKSANVKFTPKPLSPPSTLFPTPRRQQKPSYLHSRNTCYLTSLLENLFSVYLFSPRFRNFEHHHSSVWANLCNHFEARQEVSRNQQQEKDLLQSGWKLLRDWVIDKQQMYSDGDFGSPVEVLSRLITTAPRAFQALFLNQVATIKLCSLNHATRFIPNNGNQFWKMNLSLSKGAISAGKSGSDVGGIFQLMCDGGMRLDLESRTNIMNGESCHGAVLNCLSSEGEANEAFSSPPPPIIFCNVTIEQRTQFDFPPMLQFGTRVWDLVARITATQDWGHHFVSSFQRFGTFFYYDDLDGAAVEVQSGEHFGFKQFGYQVFYVERDEMEE